MSVPVFVPNRYLPDIWADGVQQVEVLSGGMRRIVFYRNRVTSDGVQYREPVVALLCSLDSIPRCLRNACALASGPVVVN